MCKLHIHITREMGTLCIMFVDENGQIIIDAPSIELCREDIVQLQDYFKTLDLSKVTSKTEL